jgi:hypothetical protein
MPMKITIVSIVMTFAAMGLLAGGLFAADRGELMKNGDFDKGKESWALSGIKGSQATIKFAQDGPNRATAATIAVTAAGNESGKTHVYLSQNGFALSQGKRYHLSFMVKGSGLPRMTVVLKSPSGWKDIAGAKRDFDLKPDWQTIAVDFTPAKDEANASCFFTGINNVGAVVSLARVSLKEVAK